MVDPDRAAEILTHFHTMGVWVVTDDFWVGDTSLAYLKSFADQHVEDRSARPRTSRGG